MSDYSNSGFREMKIKMRENQKHTMAPQKEFRNYHHSKFVHVQAESKKNAAPNFVSVKANIPEPLLDLTQFKSTLTKSELE